MIIKTTTTGGETYITECDEREVVYPGPLWDAGYDSGYTVGHSDGYAAGYKQAQKDAENGLEVGMECPSCRKKVNVIVRKGIYGYCPHCGIGIGFIGTLKGKPIFKID